MANTTLIGIGNAAIDIICSIPDSLLPALGAHKGSCVFPDLNEFMRMSHVLEKKGISSVLEPGGAAANTLCAFSVLGGMADFIGKVSNDAYGDVFLKSFANYGVGCHISPLPQNVDRSTSLYAYITPDGERSFASYYGASNYLVPDDLVAQPFDDCAMLYVDSYILMSAHGFETTLAAIARAKAHGALIVLNPSSLSVLDARAEAYKTLMNLADAIICNADEAQKITGSDTLSHTLEVLAKGRVFTTVTCGSDGALAMMDGKAIHVPNPPLTQPLVNTNGAGDNYAGGFLYGMINKRPLEECVRLGLDCAIKVLYEHGPRQRLIKIANDR